jgi:hypothetical protein
VAATTWPGTAEGLEELVLELRAELDAAEGTTLLVPLAASQRERARELLSRLGAADVPARDGAAALALWEETERPLALRRAARQSARVLVIAGSGEHPLWEVLTLRQLLAGEERIGFLMVGLGTDLATHPDRVGEVRRFWSRPRATKDEC